MANEPWLEYQTTPAQAPAKGPWEEYQTETAQAPVQPEAPKSPTISERLAAGYRTAKDEIPYVQSTRKRDAYFDLAAKMGKNPVTDYFSVKALIPGSDMFDDDKYDYDTLFNDAKKAGLVTAKDRKEFERNLLQRDGERFADLKTVYDNPISGTIGGLGSFIHDPLNVGASLVTGGLSKGMSLGKALATEAGVNALTELAQVPLTDRALEAMGEDLTPEQAAARVAMAGAFGAGLHGLFRSLGIGDRVDAEPTVRTDETPAVEGAAPASTREWTDEEMLGITKMIEEGGTVDDIAKVYPLTEEQRNAIGWYVEANKKGQDQKVIFEGGDKPAEEDVPFEAPDFLNQPVKGPFKETPAFLNESAAPRTVEDLPKPAKGKKAVSIENSAKKTSASAPGAVKEPETAPIRVPVNKAVDHINDITSDWKAAPEFSVAGRLEDLPDNVRRDIIEDGAEDAIGVTVDGKVYILAHNIKDADELSAVTFHEALGHVGLERMFRQRLDAILTQMYNTNEMVRNSADGWLAKNSTQAGNPIAHAVEEILAEVSADGKIEARILDKVRAFLKQYARRIPGLKNLKYTDKEVYAILSMAHQKVTDGGRSVGRTGNRYMRLWHGTPHDFDQFDHSKMGTGEGSQAYGYGTYLAEERKVAEWYKDRLSENKKNKGTLLEVEVPDDSSFVKWDDKLSTQKDITDKLEKAGWVKQDALWKKLSTLQEEIGELKSEYGIFSREVKEARTKIAPLLSQKAEKSFSSDWFGQRLYYQTINQLEKTALKTEKDRSAIEKMASEYLDSIGIKGTKYLDQNSRPGGKGTYNYVIYTDKTPKIVNKYSKPDAEGGRTRGLRLDKIVTKDDEASAKFIKELQKELPDKYTQSWEETEAMAERIGMNINKLEKMADGINPEHIKAAEIFTVGKLNMITDLQKKLDGNKWTLKDRDNLIVQTRQFVEALKALEDIKSAQGRNLNILRTMTINNKAGTNKVRYALAQAEKNGLSDVESMKQLANALDELKKNPKGAAERGYSKAYEYFMDVINLPRTLQSTYDMSGPFRQGINLVSRKEFWKAYAKMLSYAKSEKAYLDLLEDIKTRPTYGAMQNAKLFIAELEDGISGREEAFLSKLAGRVPGVRISERAYNGFLNKLRADTFDTIYKNGIKAGADLSEDSKALRDLGSFINNATGRGSIKHIDQSMPILSAMFFSPKLIASRVQMLNPFYYARLDPMVRKEALKSAMSLGAIAMTIGGLAQSAGADVESDPRSSDFMKIKTGDTRYDILGGYGQYITLASRLMTNEKKTTAGVIKQYGTKFGEENRLDAIEKFFENKFSPVASFVADYYRGTDAVGKEFKMDEAVTKRMIPLYLQDAYEIMEEEGAGTGALMAIPGLFGIGTQTYKDERGGFEMKDRSTDDPAVQEIQRLGGDKDIVTTGNKTDAKALGIPELDEEQLKQYRDYSSQLISAAVKEAMATPEWKEASDEERVKWVKRIGKDMRQMAREDLFGSNNEEEQPWDEYNDEE